MYTSLNNSQSRIALCFTLLDKSILYLLQSPSSEFEEPGYLPLAISKVSITLSFFISFFFINLSS